MKNQHNVRNIVLLILFIIPLVLFIINLCFFIVDLQVPPHVHLVRGLKYSAKGDYDSAIKAYDEAIEIKPDYASAYALRSESYRAKDKDKDKDKDAQSNADWDKASELRKAQ